MTKALRVPDYLNHILRAIERNRVSHGYDKVDLEIVWKTVQSDLPCLYVQVQGIQPPV